MSQKETAEVREQTLKPITPAPTITKRNKLHLPSRFASITAIILSITASLAAIGITIDNLVNHNKVTITTDRNGRKTYRHSNPETTHMINYLAGREKLTLEERTENIKTIFKKALTSFNHIELPENFDSFTLEELDAYMVGLAPKIGLGEIRPGELAELISIEMKETCPRDRDVYDDLWQLNIEAGAPDVAMQSGFVPFAQEANGALNATYWGPFNHKISLLTADCELEPYIAEMAHAIQFQPHTLRRYSNILRILKDLSRIYFSSLTKGTDIVNEYYTSTYNDPTTIEYEAHQKIEAELRKKYPNLVIPEEAKGYWVQGR